MSGQDKMKIRVERKTTAEQRKVRRQVFKHLNMFCILTKNLQEFKKKMLFVTLSLLYSCTSKYGKHSLKSFIFSVTPVIFDDDTVCRCF